MNENTLAKKTIEAIKLILITSTADPIHNLFFKKKTSFGNHEFKPKLKGVLK